MVTVNVTSFEVSRKSDLSQSSYNKVLIWTLFMNQNPRFGLVSAGFKVQECLVHTFFHYLIFQINKAKFSQVSQSPFLSTFKLRATTHEKTKFSFIIVYNFIKLHLCDGPNVNVVPCTNMYVEDLFTMTLNLSSSGHILL